MKRRHMGKLPILLGLMLLLLALQAWAGGPRFVTGMGYASKGQMMAFYTSQPTYYTDPGALGSTVSHAQADAMVAAAAAVWNVPTANLTLSQGGDAGRACEQREYVLRRQRRSCFPADVMADELSFGADRGDL